MNTALRSRRPNGGFTLLEMLVYVAIFGLTINILASLLMTGARLSATAALSLDRLAGVRDVQEAFTTYTRRASGVAVSAGSYTTGEDTLVLAMPPSWGYDYAVLGKLGEDGGDHFGVLRLRNGDSGLESDFLQFRAQPLAHLRFEVDESGARPVVHMEIQVKPESGERDRGFRMHRTAATPRGTTP
ncbi:MAG: type II secretion system protein [Candidatus Hydrogenedentes bacterium]|nr:type II secretion system protein [Candidatus Hydrogenedentota bacterium]